jgi:carbon-monoxide dehydrogenase medium subunit
MINFEYHAPTNLQEALNLLRQHGDDAKLLAGGTGLINLMKQRLAQPAVIVDIRNLSDLNYVRAEDGQLRIGALTTHRQVETSPIALERVPLLANTYKHVATIRIRNIATVGGGLAHADPNQDPPPAYLVLGASVKAVSPSGERIIPVEDLFVDYYETILQPDELLTEIQVPVPSPNAGSAFIKFLPKTADDYATVSAAALLTLGEGDVCQDVRLAFGSAGSTAIRARNAENSLRGQKASVEAFRVAAAAAKDEVDPLSDPRGSAEYKRDMAEVFARRALEQAFADAQARLAASGR